MRFNVPRDSALKQTGGIKNVTLKVAKKFVRVAVYWKGDSAQNYRSSRLGSNPGQYH